MGLQEHSENKIIRQSGMFENEIGPEVFQSNVRQSRTLLEYQRHTPHATDFVSILSIWDKTFADYMFVEYWIRALAGPTLFL